MQLDDRSRSQDLYFDDTTESALPRCVGTEKVLLSSFGSLSLRILPPGLG